MENGQMTHAEQNLLLLESAIPADEQFYIWCFGSDGRYIDSSCPPSLRPILEQELRLFGGLEKAAAHAESPLPRLIGSPIGMQWAVTYETERGQSLLFLLGPVFYQTPTEQQLRAALRPLLNTREALRWSNDLLRVLPELPVMPHAIFTRYVIMAHNMLTREQLDVSMLYSPTEDGRQTSAPAQNRDRVKVYQAERAMLKMVQNGDINYRSALARSSSLSPGVPVRGRDLLQQARVSIVVFTTLVCRAAMEGGLSPEIAYPLGDSYIETTLTSRDAGELNALASTMYHDFIYRVHHLRSNPNYSPAIQKCCDYIELSLDKRLQLADLAALTGYTEYYLTEKFKKETGTPLFLYIRYAKIERAKVLLESTDLSVGEIADRLAFNTVNYFIKCFREIAGYTPARYRKKYKNV